MVVKFIKEKQVISNKALVGFHYWKEVWFCKIIIRKFPLRGFTECYLGETYNYLEKETIIKPFYIANHQYIPLGTKEDIAIFIGKNGEFGSKKPYTLFIDLDGTLIKHKHAISLVHSSEVEQLNGVRQKLDQWDSIGHKIIIVTARKESERRLTIDQLESLAIPYDLLIMGVTSGPRVLINDKIKFNAVDRAQSATHYRYWFRF